ncbi:MAG: transglutaminase family protein [Gammaproteobacteria bacterium]|nr:transglutaminase family protein [Gammaproteobacteria bacterium]
MNYRIVHITEYHYSGLVGLCHNEARLTPRDLPHQSCQQSTITIDPVAVDFHQRHDFFGNTVSYFSVQQAHERLTITATSEVTITPQTTPFDNKNDLAWEVVAQRLRSERSSEMLNILQYTLDSPMIVVNPEVAAYAKESFPPGRKLMAAVSELMQRIFADFTYDPEFSNIATPISEVLEHRRGVCQDFAHLAIACLRSQGIAARYVSGYIETLPQPGKERLVGADASHAWFSTYFPAVGWIDFDPTNNQMPKERHITVAWGRDFDDVTPLKGVAFGGGENTLSVSVDVKNLG